MQAAVPGNPAQQPTLLESITEFCRTSGVAESTFGRRAVNDGKLVARLREGSRIRPETLARLQAFMRTQGARVELGAPPELQPLVRGTDALPGAAALRDAPDGHGAHGANGAHVANAAIGAAEGAAPGRNFRFFDNRQKYLLFVTTCGEKDVIARRVGMELAQLHPRPPALRLFDAGMGDGTVLTAVMREMHRRHPTMPFYVVGKEISLEDVRLSLHKMADRFFEHPSTVLVVTNMYYAEAPWLAPRSLPAASSLLWKEVALAGSTSHEFAEQIGSLDRFLAQHWQARHSPKTGNPIYERPVVLVIHRADYRFLLDRVIPRQGAAQAEFDLVIASQPYRARVSAEFKAQKVIAPLVRALGPGGRLLGIHSCGNDPGLEIVQRIWPGETPFTTTRHDVLAAVRHELARDARHYHFNAFADSRAVFRYDMHTLPNEVAAAGTAAIGTSTLFAAWNAAVYVAQIDDERLAQVIGRPHYLEATAEVLKKHGSLWFLDESYVVSRKRD
ncbi:MAG: hypothetical protein KIT17_04520 [Rubrivivax sp.]|nr:hypothetical protein [Rubrivivax sp.]